jgi:hypothetical protein
METEYPKISNGTCDWRTPFDRLLEVHSRDIDSQAAELINTATGGKDSDALYNCSVFVHDTLKLAEASARTVFGAKAKPELALMIFDRIMGLLEKVDIAARDERRKEQWGAQSASIDAIAREHASL